MIAPHLTTLLGALVLAAPVAAQQQINRRIPIAADASIRIHNMAAGSVRVTGWDRDSVVVTGTAPSGQFFMGGGERAAKMGVEDDPSARPGSSVSHLEIRLPRGSRVWIKTAGADIHVADVTGGLDLYSVSGGIRVMGGSGQVYAESMDGNVDVTADARWVRTKTAAGSVTLRLPGGDVTASSVSGNLVIVGGQFERGRFESVTGDIRFSGDFDRGGAFNFESHGGTVELELPASVSASFEVSTFHGKITDDLTHTRTRPSRTGTGTTLSAETGAGGAEVTVRSFKGNVVLRQKE